MQQHLQTIIITWTDWKGMDVNKILICSFIFSMKQFSPFYQVNPISSRKERTMRV